MTMLQASVNELIRELQKLDVDYVELQDHDDALVSYRLLSAKWLPRLKEISESLLPPVSQFSASPSAAAE